MEFLVASGDEEISILDCCIFLNLLIVKCLMVKCFGKLVVGLVSFW